MSTDSFPIEIKSLCYREVGLDYSVKAHVHNIYQWYLVLHGDVRTRVGEKTLQLGPEESVIVAPGVVRDRACEGKAPGYMIAGFENKGLELDSISGQILNLPEDLRPDLHSLISEIRQPGVPNAEALITALVVRLLVGLHRHVHAKGARREEGASALNARHRDEIVSQVETYMRRNIFKAITRQDMASAVHVSEAHLARLFRQKTGKTLGRRLTEFRMEHARSLLLESDMSITSIAMEVGFASFSHFARLFKKEVGITPSDYRRSGGHAWVDSSPNWHP